MNERFVCIKVDREERPDVDAIYMDAVQAMTGHGGWPMNAFLMPDAGAVLRRHVLPAESAPRPAELAGTCSTAIAEAWRTPRARTSSPGRRSSNSLRRRPRARAPTPTAYAAAARRRDRASLERSYDPNGGFGGAPKFPQAIDDRVPARARRRRRRHGAAMIADARRWRAAASTTRSAADSRATRSTPDWLVPHFEKMLYDNALLVRAYLHALQVSGESLFAGLLARRSTGCCASCAEPEGGFASRAGRGLRGRRGQVLRVDGWTSCAPALGRELCRHRHRALRA